MKGGTNSYRKPNDRVSLGVTFQVSSMKAASVLRWNAAWATAMATVDWLISPSRNSAKASPVPCTGFPFDDLCGRVGREGVIAARVLIAELVEILAIVFEAEFEAVLALVPGHVVDELSGVVFVLVRAIGIIAEAAVTIFIEGHGRDAPGDGQASPADWEGSIERRTSVV